jgi:serine phosphatase RsbU (regulator of sigma subunit)
MGSIVSNILSNTRIKAAVILFSLLLLFRLIFISVNSVLTAVLSESLLILLLLSAGLFLVNYSERKEKNPLGLIMNVAVLNAFVFFLLTFSSNLYTFFQVKAKDFSSNPQLLLFTFSFIALVLTALVCVYTLVVFRRFYYWGDKRKSGLYLNLMLLFFALAAIFNTAAEFWPVDFAKKAFLANSVILIIFNSVRISWIAFLSKKEKKQLLFVSILLIFLFGLNVNYFGDANGFMAFIKANSPAVYELLCLTMTYGIIYFGVLFFTTLFHLPTAEAFDRKVAEVSSLQNFSALISQVVSLNELAETVTDIALKVSKADAAWIIWFDENGWKLASAINISITDSAAISEIIIAKGTAGQNRAAFLLNIAKSEKTALLSEKYSEVIVSPLKSHSSVNGYLVAAKKNNLLFDDEDKAAVNTFSEYASVAIENSKLVEGSIEKERLERELEVAREMQQKIIPQKPPETEGVSISTVFIPAFEVGGDYYDFFNLPGKQLGFTIADVSGKGISAAFIMAEIKGIFESLSRLLSTPRDILTEANFILKKSLSRKSFVSAIYGTVSPESGKLKLARAGHTPVILLRNERIDYLKPSGMGLGLDFSGNFGTNLEEIEIQLEKNDTLILYTDGITEAKNTNMEDFGAARLEKVIFENRENSTDDLSRAIISEVTMFSKNNHQHDDITLVILRWKEKKIMDGDK